MKIILAEQYTKRNFFHYVKPGCLFIASRQFLRYLRLDRQSFYDKYYKFTVSEITKMNEENLPTLMYLNQTKTGFYEDHIFLFGKEKLFMFNEDLDQLRYVEIKIISKAS